MADDLGRASAAAPSAHTSRRYAAFISYSHRDEEFGDWLHKRLESYQVPSALVGRASPVGPIGKRLGKVFRDRADLSAAHDLGREIREGLEQSDALIVLCSPRSCGSKYVQEEIRAFKQMGKGQRIFAAIIDGEPHAAGRPGYTAADECFPPALIYALDQDGAVSSQLESTEPIAADFREGKDGRENGSLKIVAGLLDVGLDELIQRERQAERQRRLRANVIAAVMAALALCAVGASGFALVQRNEALQQRALAESNERDALRQRRAAEANAEAELRQRMRADRETLRAIDNAREAERQSGIASENARNARSTLLSVFAQRAYERLRAGDVASGARYALAGAQLADEQGLASRNGEEFRALLGAILHEAGESTFVEFSEPPRWLGQTSRGVRVVSYRSPERPGINVWDASSGQHLVSLPQAMHPALSNLESVALNFAETELFTANYSGVAMRWRLNSGEPIQQLGERSGSLSEIQVAPSGTLALIGGNRIARIWDLEGSVRDLPIDEDRRWFNIGAISRDAQIAVLGGRGGPARVWSTTDGRLLWTLGGGSSGTTAVSISADGTRIATGGDDGRVRIWQEGEEEIVIAAHAGRVASVSYSPDGGYLASAGDDGMVAMWRASDGAPVGRVRGQRRISHIAFSADSRSLFSMGGVGVDHTVRQWRSPFTHLVMALPPSRANTGSQQDAGANFANARNLWRLQFGALMSWDREGRIVATQDVALGPGSGAREFARFSGDGEHVLAFTPAGVPSVLHVASGRVAPLQGFNGRVCDVAFSPDGRQIAVAPCGGVVGIWSTQNGERLNGDFGAATALAFSPTGELLVTGDEENVLRVWNTQTRRLMTSMEGHGSTLSGQGINVISFSPDGQRILTGANDGTARVWSMGGGRNLAVLGGQDELVFRAEYSASGSWIFTFDQLAVRVWDARTSRLVITLRERNIRDIVATPDSSLIIAAVSDRVQIWSAANGRPLAAIPVREATNLSVSPEGERLIVTFGSGEIQVWDISPLTQSWRGLAEAACTRLLDAQARRFTPEELGDVLLVSEWRDANRDVCES